jgi:hypothetical protein
VTLELSKLTGQVQTLGQTLAERERKLAGLIELAQKWLRQYAEDGERLRQAARAIRAAVPSNDPLDVVHQSPPVPEQLTVAATDGSQIHPDQHGPALYYLINVGSLVYRHGSGEKPQAQSIPMLGYTEEELYENGTLVSGKLLDMRRDLAELTHLADICEAYAPERVVALVDGSLLMWSLEELPASERQRKAESYLEQLERIREAGGVVAGFISRPRHSEVTKLLHLAHQAGDAKQATKERNPLEHLPDRAVFEMLPAGARSALFTSSASVNESYYRPAGHMIYFCYMNLAMSSRRKSDLNQTVISRLEAPAWVAEDSERLDLLHGAVVAQSRITGDYPYALARADELAYISGRERMTFEGMVTTALLRAGVISAPSPKAHYKRLTRWGR